MNIDPKQTAIRGAVRCDAVQWKCAVCGAIAVSVAVSKTVAQCGAVRSQTFIPCIDV